jgi:guanylate kinase
MHSFDTPPAVARALKRRAKSMQEGTIISYTVMPSHTVGLVELADGSRVLAELLTANPVIGQSLRPRMILRSVNSEGLRIYDVAYEPVVSVAAPKDTLQVRGYIIALSGPVGVGKTTVSALLAKTFPDSVELVQMVTTSPVTRADRNERECLSKEKFAELWKGKKLAAAMKMVVDDEEVWTGYRMRDIEQIWAKGRVPLVVTDVRLLRELSRTLGRRSILSFGLLPPGRSRRSMLSHLLHRLRAQGKATEEQMSGLLKHAVSDLRLLSSQRDLFTDILVNDNLETVTETVQARLQQTR